MAEEQEQDDDGGQNVITVNVPLFIRLLEYAREDAKDDRVLHEIAERAVALMREDECLGMDDYDDLVPGEGENNDNGAGYPKVADDYVA